MKSRCCRSSPRCAGCPVRVAAATRRDRRLTESAALVAEILGGRPATPLPAGVVEALERFRRARDSDDEPVLPREAA
jgi:hypothetical protein